jgi:hypothetical protein
MPRCLNDETAAAYIADHWHLDTDRPTTADDVTAAVNEFFHHCKYELRRATQPTQERKRPIGKTIGNLARFLRLGHWKVKAHVRTAPAPAPAPPIAEEATPKPQHAGSGFDNAPDIDPATATPIVIDETLTYHGDIVLSAWEPSSIMGNHGTIHHMKGCWYGRIGTTRLPKEISKLPAMSRERADAFGTWRTAELSRAYAAIERAQPARAAIGTRDYGEITIKMAATKARSRDNEPRGDHRP